MDINYKYDDYVMNKHAYIYDEKTEKAYIVFQHGIYRGAVGTLIDNVTYPRYAKVFLHINKDVRVMHTLKVGDEILYLSNDNYDNYNIELINNEYKELTEEEIINTLTKVLMFYNPMLQGHTLAGHKGGINNDCNYYHGTYILRNNEEYTILKHYDRYEFYKGIIPYTNMFKDEAERGFFHTGTIDFDLYQKSIFLYNIKKKVMERTYTLILNGSLKKEIDTIEILEKEIKNILNI